MLTADNVDVLNGMLDSGKLKTVVQQVFQTVVNVTNTKAKKRTNDVRDDEDMQHYLECIQCFAKLTQPKLPYDIRAAYAKKYDTSEVMIVSAKDFKSMKHLKPENEMELGCVLATFGFNVKVFQYYQIMLVSKCEIDEKKVEDIRSALRSSGIGFPTIIHFIAKCVCNAQKPIKMKRTMYYNNEPSVEKPFEYK